MISKTIKTFLFASIVAVMIIPFYMGEMVDAEQNENVEDKDKVDSLKVPNAERDLKLATGYKLYPGVGWVKVDEQNIVAAIYRDNPENSEEQILDLDAMIEKSKEAKIRKTVGNMIQDFLNSFFPKLAEASNGYNQIVHKDSSSNEFTYHRAYWNVPDAPSSYDSGTNFSFPAVQPSSGSGIVFQPVLQHGQSSICDAGDKWVTFALIYAFGVGYHTPCEDAEVGDRIRGTLSETNNVWTIAVKNYENSDADDSMLVYYSGPMDFGSLVVETYNLSDSCSQLQGDLEFETVTNTGDVDSWVTAGTGQFCGQSETIVSDSNIEFFNDN